LAHTDYNTARQRTIQLSSHRLKRDGHKCTKYWTASHV